MGRKRMGQIALPFMLLVGSIVIEIAIAGSLAMYFFGSSRLSDRLYARASAAAMAGVRDAMVAVARNKDFIATGCAATSTLTVNNDAASVGVCRAADETTNSYTYTITSIGNAGTRRKKFVATIIVDQTTGKMGMQSITEQTAD